MELNYEGKEGAVIKFCPFNINYRISGRRERMLGKGPIHGNNCLCLNYQQLEEFEGLAGDFVEEMKC